MRISSGNNRYEVDPEVIQWSTSDAPFLPAYALGLVFSVFIGAPHLTSPYPALAFLPAVLASYCLYKTARAFEAHRNLKRLERLYAQLEREG